ncbi:Trp biosynthesis-associated membrane protein [Nocardioides mangrovicus]|uniref:Trp biosynthesis-associated membrane protein n=1 Tax=Nocardioides mangrovicus TaxID=2478913 RepID=UPI0013147F1E|nr:Trp biosynthesis-associated membrane protein [Nocardioides mangrovicus]
MTPPHASSPVRSAEQRREGSARVGRRTFGPVVLVGLASAVLLAVAAARVWVSHSLTVGGRDAGIDLVGSDLGKEALAAPLAYVLLVGWGVVLVTRGAVRRVAAVVVVLVALGLLVDVVLGGFGLADDVRSAFASQTKAGARLHTGFTAWYWVALAAAVVALIDTLVALRVVGTWPTMGRRYDAPSAQSDAPRAVARPDADPDDPEGGNRALWKAIDEGDDPTTPGERDR